LHPLTERQRAAFRADGYVAPLDVMGRDEAESYRTRVEEFVATVPDSVRRAAHSLLEPRRLAENELSRS
jgi:hypothetical protein